MTYSPSAPKGSARFSLRTLLADFGHKMRQIHRLNLKIDRAATHMDAKPKLRLRMDSWLAQLGLLKSEEDKTLAMIKDIEKRHQNMRLKKQLKMAKSMDPLRNGPEPSGSSRQRTRWLMFWLVILYMLMRPRKAKSLLFGAPTNG